MADRGNGEEGRDDGPLALKNLFYGACSLIVILGGLTWGLFTSQHTDEVDRTNRINDTQWQRLRELNDAAIRREAEIERLRKDVDDQEARIRTLEHRNDRR